MYNIKCVIDSIFIHCSVDFVYVLNKMTFNSCLEYCNRYTTVVIVLVNIMYMHMACQCHVYMSKGISSLR